MERDGGDTELVVVNPTFILGPTLTTELRSSLQLVKAMLDGTMSVVRRQRFGLADVRDVAGLHIAAMATPEATGKRFLALADGPTMTVEHKPDVVLTPADEDGAAARGLGGDGVHLLGGELVGNVGDDQIASWRERVQVPGDDAGRVVGVGDIVQAGDELQSHRLAEVQVFPRGGQNRVHVPQVRPDYRGALIVRHQRFGVQEDDRVVNCSPSNEAFPLT